MFGNTGIGLQGRVCSCAVEVGGEEVVGGGGGDGGCRVDCCGREGSWAMCCHADRFVECWLESESTLSRI